MPASAEPMRGCGARAKALALAVCAAAALTAATAPAARAQMAEVNSTSALRVCADPAADPVSSKDLTGYENRIADLVGEKLGLPVEYTWFPMATGFIRNTLKAGKCDVVIGYAQGHELVQNTNHYLTSAYAIITPAAGPLADVTTLSDPRLQGLRIGVMAGAPPATHMARRGLIGKAKPYALFTDRRNADPAGDMLRDLAAGEIDAAILWGPIGGPLARRDHPDFQVTPLLQEEDSPRLHYRITMGVRQGEQQWKRKLNSLIRRNQDEIDRILSEAGVPVLDAMGRAVKEPPA